MKIICKECGEVFAGGRDRVLCPACLSEVIESETKKPAKNPTPKANESLIEAIRNADAAGLNYGEYMARKYEYMEKVKRNGRQ